MAYEDQSSWQRTLGSIFWALAPLYTFGLAAPFTIGFAAARLRSLLVGLSAVLYAVCIWLWLGIDPSEGDNVTASDGLAILALVTSTIGAAVHSLALRRRVFGGRRPKSANQAVLELAQQRRGFREQAREIAERDPSLAWELRIGRPDLPRQYDDGGLVDMNHAPVETIAALPGMTPRFAAQVVEARTALGAFVSAEDVLAAASLPPQMIDALDEYTIYLQ